ncbi:MAG: HEAT repeat domain-containing protein [Planctomycetota bacterium]|nr:HEAT repeat domain-containing protein [Planctomycetota bacterium]
MSEDLPKGEDRGNTVPRRRWGLYVQVLVILLLVGAGIAMILMESPSRDTPEAKVRVLVAEIERQYSDDWLSELVHKFFPRYGRDRGWFDVADDLATLGVEALPEIITATKHGLPCVRLTAAEALGEIGDQRAVAPLIDLLARDSDWDVRKHAAIALGNLGGPEATARLIEAMADPEPQVRKAVAEALGMVGGPEATARLIEAMGDPEPEVRWCVAFALGLLRGPEVSARLIEAMADPEPEVRTEVAWALGEIGDTAATARLTEAMTDPEPEVREAARKALQRIRAVGQAQTPSAPPQN